MANSDYETRGAGAICPTATLYDFMPASGAVADVQMMNYSSQDGNLPAVGAAVLIDNEIMRVMSATQTTLSLGRGCGDTVPAFHPANSTIWFFDHDNDTVGTDEREYVQGETIGVKVLMRTSGQTLETKQSPANALTFVGRFGRPYPPGNVLVDGTSFHLPRVLDDSDTDFTLTWVPRNRITQGDVLIHHAEGAIAAEVDTTYVIEVRRGSDNALVATKTPGAVLTYTYTRAMAAAELGLAATPNVAVPAYLLLYSLRDGIRSLQPYRINLTAKTTVTGWGANWGGPWGN